MLHDILPRWQVRYLADGLALTPPEGRALGGIRIRERVQPVRRARDVIAWAREQMQAFGPLTITPVETFTTYEGEFAAVCTIVGARGDLPYERTIGLVWGDYFFTQIDGGTDDAAAFPRFRKAVRDLAYYHALGLGELRRRRFVYTPPPGWRGYPRGLVTEWYAPEFPARHGFISVFPARAGRESPSSELDQLLHEMSWFGFEQESIEGPIELASDDLTGSAWRPVGRFATGPRLFFEIAVLRDQRFTYVARLESQEADLDEHRRLFADVVRSVEPLPAPVAPGGTTTFSHLFA